MKTFLGALAIATAAVIALLVWNETHPMRAECPTGTAYVPRIGACIPGAAIPTFTR